MGHFIRYSISWKMKVYLVTESENFNNRIRIYYKLTPRGKSVVAEKLTEMSEFLETLRKIVEPQSGLEHA